MKKQTYNYQVVAVIIERRTDKVANPLFTFKCIASDDESARKQFRHCHPDTKAHCFRDIRAIQLSPFVSKAKKKTNKNDPMDGQISIA